MTLYISYPDIPWRAQRLFMRYGSADADAILRNTIYGERYQLHRGTPDGSFVLGHVCDLGAAVTAACSHLIIARANTLRSGDTIGTISLDGSNNDSAYTTAHTTDLSSATLYGPRSEDYIATFSASSAFRYWRWYSIGTTTATRTVSKYYFGAAFHMGSEPEFQYDLVPFDSEYYGESGERDMFRHDLPIYRIKLNWTRVTDDKVTEFNNSIVRYSHRHRFFLYTTDQHQVLNNVRVLHCKLIRSNTSNAKRKVDYNDIEAEFEEVLG